MATHEAFVLDRAYQQKACDVLLEALFKGFMDEKSRCVVLRTGDLCEVMLKLQAMLLAGSMSPSALRQWTEGYGRRLYRATLDARAHDAAQGSPFQHVHIDGAVN